MSNADISFSPSMYHRNLLANTRPTMSYSGGDIAEWQQKLRQRLSELMGFGGEERSPLVPRTLWKKEHPLGTIEKVVFISEPYADVMAYVCLPRDVAPPYDFWICLQGHSTGAHVSIARERENEDAPFAVEGDRDFGLGCMRRGMAALCIEQRSFGERREQTQKSVSDMGCHDATMQALALGKTLIGERVFDVDRGIDYLSWRGDAKMNRIGVMGNSGGGTTTLFSAALLPRIAFAMPSCYFCTFRDSIMQIYHCADNYIPGIIKVAEMADIMGLFAPRPVVVVAGETDSIFPIQGVQKAFAQLQRIYQAADAPENCRLVIGQGGHRFYADDAWPVMLERSDRATCIPIKKK
jgi:dienelactone hydrolase